MSGKNFLRDMKLAVFLKITLYKTTKIKTKWIKYFLIFTI